MKSEEKKNKILTTARELFAQQGFYATATAKIVKQAGVSNGILFHYFPTKDDLIRSLYFEIKDRLYTEVMKGMKADAKLEELFFHFWNLSIDFQLNHPDDFKFILQYESSTYFKFEKEMQHPFIQQVLKLWEDAIEQNVIKPAPAIYYYRMAVGYIEGYVKYAIDNSETTELRNQTFFNFWNAIKQ